MERKGKSRPEPGPKRGPGARKRGLAILDVRGSSDRGVGKITAGITGLWLLRVHIDAAF